MSRELLPRVWPCPDSPAPVPGPRRRGSKGQGCARRRSPGPWFVFPAAQNARREDVCFLVCSGLCPATPTARGALCAWVRGGTHAPGPKAMPASWFTLCPNYLVSVHRSPKVTCLVMGLSARGRTALTVQGGGPAACRFNPGSGTHPPGELGPAAPCVCAQSVGRSGILPPVCPGDTCPGVTPASLCSTRHTSGTHRRPLLCIFPQTVGRVGGCDD